MKVNSLPKSDILSDKKIFNFLFKNGNFIYGKFVDIVYCKADEFKIGFAVSKKIRGSVKRNRLKRKMKEIYRTNKDSFPSNTYMIILAKRNEVEFFELKNEILSKVLL